MKRFPIDQNVLKGVIFLLIVIYLFTIYLYYHI